MCLLGDLPEQLWILQCSVRHAVLWSTLRITIVEGQDKVTKSQEV